MNECSLPNVCGSGALCTNFPGGHHCECPEGYTGDAYGTGCHDMDECSRAPCGKDALCHNTEGSFRCSCPPGFVGDPFHSCKGTRRTQEALLCGSRYYTYYFYYIIIRLFNYCFTQRKNPKRKPKTKN